MLRLKVQQIKQICLFELSSANGKQVSASLPCPELLFQLYKEWQQAYLNFYKKALRARVAATGKINPMPEDWHRQLVETETKMLSEFANWLRRAELYELRAEIVRNAHNPNNKESHTSDHIDIFLTCNSRLLERLPWETWELTTEFGSKAYIRLARTPVNIHTSITSNRQLINSSKVRILAILGDNTGLNFQGDKQALRSLEKVAEIEVFTWQSGQSTAEIKTQIQSVLIDPQGWDVLFFAGHSNETILTGGELAIAPGVSISVQEIAPQLQIAQARGLQFALFNSCSGLSLANSLIDLGLSQVAVMREPIHNQVAQVFLGRFLRGLAAYKDVHDALILACEYLKQEQNLIYPSAYLIPSLFCHPEAKLFKIEPRGWQHQLQKWLPTRPEAIALCAFTLISLISPLQNWLLDSRILIQSIYRDLTNQIPPVTTPPVLLVQIDDRSISEAGISDPYPMDRSYIAKIVDRLTSLDARVIGIDYLFDRQQPAQDPILAQSIQQAIEQNNTWFILAGIKNPEGTEIGVNPQTSIAHPNWSLQGYTNALPRYVKLPESNNCVSSCPFTYLLAIAAALHQESLAPSLPQPKLNSQQDFRTQVITYFQQIDRSNLTFLQQAQPHPFAHLAQTFNRVWFRPVIDFSIPPDLAYDRLSAWQLLAGSESLINYPFSQQIMIIAPGGYAQAGVTPGADNFSVPLSVAYWRERLGLASGNPRKFTGSEANAYMIHHLLTQRLVIPIPDFLAIVLVGLVGKGIMIVLKKNYRQHKNWVIFLTGTVIIYSMVSLQLYLSAGILLPWLLPLAIFLVCVGSIFRSNYEQ